MKYIKVFEYFNSYELPNFRVELVKPGMSSGRWLFTCVDGSWNSFFGVFDLDGLRKLEDSMTTECVFAELSNAIKYGGKDKENLAFEAHTTIIVSEINSQDKYINLQYRDLDIPFFSKNPVSNVSNPPPGLVVGEDGLHDEHIVHGYSVTTSKSPLKESHDEEDIQNYPIVVNELNYVDHHWSDHQRTMDYEKAFDETVGFRKRPIEGVDYEMKDIEPYMASIIDVGIPRGVLRAIEGIKKLKPKPSLSDLEMEFNKLNLEINKISRSNFSDLSSDFEVQMEQKKKALIKTKQEVEPLIKRMEYIIQDLIGKLDDKKIEGMKFVLDSQKKLWVYRN